MPLKGHPSQEGRPWPLCRQWGNAARAGLLAGVSGPRSAPLTSPEGALLQRRKARGWSMDSGSQTAWLWCWLCCSQLNLCASLSSAVTWKWDPAQSKQYICISCCYSFVFQRGKGKCTLTLANVQTLLEYHQFFHYCFFPVQDPIQDLTFH